MQVGMQIVKEVGGEKSSRWSGFIQCHLRRMWVGEIKMPRGQYIRIPYQRQKKELPCPTCGILQFVWRKDTQCPVCKEKQRIVNWKKSEKSRNYIKKRNGTLQRSFGISLEGYNKLFTQQNGVCAICGKPETVCCAKINELKPLSVDHDHQTHFVRGLLCSRCNQGLGLLKDNVDYLKNAVIYLSRTQNAE